MVQVDKTVLSDNLGLSKDLALTVIPNNSVSCFLYIREQLVDDMNLAFRSK